jgi:hypothetical protein
MKPTLIFGIIAMLLFFGCATTTEQTNDQTASTTCYTVTQYQQTTTYDCHNVSTTSTSCTERQMDYSILGTTRTNICSGGNCAGSELYGCMDCTSALTRCIMTIQSNEQTATGTITAGANFTFPAGAFVKNPVSQTLKPGTTAEFEFYQSYSLATSFTTPDCSIYVTEVPLIEDCVELTETEETCTPVTSNVPVQVEVCS